MNATRQLRLTALLSIASVVALSQTGAPPKPAESPAPITQAEKDEFHKAYTEYVEIQSQYLGQISNAQAKLSSLQDDVAAKKKELDDLRAKSGEEISAKAKVAEESFKKLSPRCVAPKQFDRMVADCVVPKPAGK